MPGFAELFCPPWDDSPAPRALARLTTAAAAARQAGLAGSQQLAARAGLRCRPETFHKVLAWAEQAPPDGGHTAQRRRRLVRLGDDRLAKSRQILEPERDPAHRAVRAPDVLPLAIPGINLVAVADLAGELGPIELYANANAITGRAGLMPSRYQSDRVDRAGGPRRRRGNRRRRAVLMQTADNLAQCNHHFQARAALWQRAGKDARWLRVQVAKIFSRLAFAVVAGRQLFPHPCRQPRHTILGKLLAFHGEHATDPADRLRDLRAAAEQLPAGSCADQAGALQEQLNAIRKRRGPQPLGDIIQVVLARLAARALQSAPAQSAAP
jgi:hypothetical protein